MVLPATSRFGVGWRRRAAGLILDGQHWHAIALSIQIRRVWELGFHVVFLLERAPQLNQVGIMRLDVALLIHFAIALGRAHGDARTHILDEPRFRLPGLARQLGLIAAALEVVHLLKKN